MQALSLPMNRARRIALLFFSLCVLGVSSSYARMYDPDWTAVTPSGHTMYYSVIDDNNHYVAVTHPNPNATLNWLNTTTGLWEYPTGNLILPEHVSHNGITYTLTEIDQHTFHNCSGLTGTLVIPNSVTIIRENAFSYCSGLSSIMFGSSVSIIEKSAFSNCTGLTGTLSIPSNVQEIGQWSFDHCSGISTLELSEGLLKISNSAFQYCGGLTGSLTIPNSVTYLGQWAFAYCSGLNGTLKLSDNITMVNAYCFKGCTGLTGDLVIPKTVTKISNEAFYNCNGFSAMYFCTNSVPSKGSENNSFYGIRKNIPIYVPGCLVSNYNTQWSVFQFTNIQGRDFFNTDGNWSNAANWACNTLPSDDANIVIAAYCNLNETATVASTTILNGYTLSIMPDMAMNSSTVTNKGTAANLIIQDGGELYHDNTNVLATVMKSIAPYTPGERDGWYLISSPLAGTANMNLVENLLSNEYDLFYYDEPAAYWRNQENVALNFNTLTSGTGYLYANNQNVSINFAGRVTNAPTTITLPLSYTAESNLPGFNLVGNPYTHNITSYSTTNVATAGCYRMNANNDDLIVSAISESSPLKPAEGFFVLAEAEDASITFSSAKTRDEVKKTGSIVLDLSENGQITDRLIVKRSEEDKDFAKLSLRDNRTKLFASKEKQELAIVVCNANEQPVDFKAAKNSSYTINVTVNDLDVEYLHLIDNLTGENIDLLATPSYTFSARTTDYTSRFRLVFDPFAVDDTTESFAFISDGNFIIANEGVATLQVIDVTGRILSSENIRDSFTKPVTLSNGVYVLRLINGNDVKSQKIVVR